MVKYTAQDYTDMIMLYGVAGGNAPVSTWNDFPNANDIPIIMLFWGVFDVYGKRNRSCRLDRVLVDCSV